jgi:hypothetical protein
MSDTPRRDVTSPPCASALGLEFYVDAAGDPRSESKVTLSLDELFDSWPEPDVLTAIDEVMAGRLPSYDWQVNYITVRMTAQEYQVLHHYPLSGQRERVVDRTGPIEQMRGAVAEWNEFAARYAAPAGEPPDDL